MKLTIPALLAILFSLTHGINGQDEAAEKVVPKGNEKKGRIAFEAKRCHRCHTIKGENFPEIDIPPIDHISLVSVNQSGWTRDDYAHHIMAPQHIISPEHQKAMIIIGDRVGAETSPMPMFIDLLTVRDLIDISTYLEALGENQ